MKSSGGKFTLLLLVSIFVLTHSRAAVLFVDSNCTNSTAPFMDWSTAATNIQSAVDAASDGDQILVTNGVYSTGGRLVYGSLTNRVVVDKAVTVQSVNGPSVSIIRGYQIAGVTNGNYAVRCVYLTNNAALLGFTLINGATRDDGGSGASINLNGGGVYCESKSATLSNCIVTDNSARSWGGGVYSGTLNNCLLVSNTAGYGGGASGSTLKNCIITGNQAGGGGGVNVSMLDRCQVTTNRAANYGGGALGGTLNNCALVGNISSTNGGVQNATLNNCTVTGNIAKNGGGAGNSTLNNCILYYNSASSGPNYENQSISHNLLNYCCTFPLPTNGVGNISLEPQLADFFHLSAHSPCQAVGNIIYASGADIDGDSWSEPCSIGCDEYTSGTITGTLNVDISAATTNVAAGYPLSFVGMIAGHASNNFWDFGDGLSASNQPYVSHAWTIAGDYEVVFRAFNESNPAGVSATLIVHVVDHPVHYVALTCTNPVSPYLSWSTAATNIQDAVDASYPGGTILVSNGVYQTGGKIVYGSLTNRLVINKAVTVESVNGPAVTIIQGYQTPGIITGTSAVRCVYLTNSAVLNGFTLTGGATTRSGELYKEQSGGGVWCESTDSVLSNCVITANASFFSGGGAYSGTLNNCQITTNSGGTISYAAGGGGANASLLNNCVLAYNNATAAGGANGSTLNNCSISNNVCVLGGGGLAGGMANDCTIMGNSSTGGSGGGATGAALNNCIILNNTALNTGNGFGGGTFNSSLNDCSVIANRSRNGGGIAYGTANKSLISGNQANSGAGAYLGALNNCLIKNNVATAAGGGAYQGTLNNCTLTGNSSNLGGGAYQGALNNCISYYNIVGGGSNYFGGTLNYCCTSPAPANGAGNFTNAPLFINLTNNFQLQSHSLCINAGRNSYVVITNDLDGSPRIVGGTVDIGAYEYQTPASVISYAWLQQYGLPMDGSADFVDSDNDRMDNREEWMAGTIPTNAASVLQLASPLNSVSGMTVTWQSVTNVTYYLQTSTNLPAFYSIQSNLVGKAGSTSYLDKTATNSGPYFYRVGVQ